MNYLAPGHRHSTLFLALFSLSPRRLVVNPLLFISISTSASVPKPSPRKISATAMDVKSLLAGMSSVRPPSSGPPGAQRPETHNSLDAADAYRDTATALDGNGNTPSQEPGSASFVLRQPTPVRPGRPDVPWAAVPRSGPWGSDASSPQIPRPAAETTTELEALRKGNQPAASAGRSLAIGALQAIADHKTVLKATPQPASDHQTALEAARRGKRPMSPQPRPPSPPEPPLLPRPPPSFLTTIPPAESSRAAAQRPHLAQPNSWLFKNVRDAAYTGTNVSQAPDWLSQRKPPSEGTPRILLPSKPQHLHDLRRYLLIQALPDITSRDLSPPHQLGVVQTHRLPASEPPPPASPVTPPPSPRSVSSVTAALPQDAPPQYGQAAADRALMPPPPLPQHRAATPGPSSWGPFLGPDELPGANNPTVPSSRPRSQTTSSPSPWAFSGARPQGPDESSEADSSTNPQPPPPPRFPSFSAMEHTQHESGRQPPALLSHHPDRRAPRYPASWPLYCPTAGLPAVDGRAGLPAAAERR